MEAVGGAFPEFGIDPVDGVGARELCPGREFLLRLLPFDLERLPFLSRFIRAFLSFKLPTELKSRTDDDCLDKRGKPAMNAVVDTNQTAAY